MRALLPVGWRPLHVLGTLALVLLVAACSRGTELGDDPAGRLAKDQTAGSCKATRPTFGTVTPDGQDLIPGASTLDAQESPDDESSKAGAGEAKEIEAAARNFINCWNQRKYEDVLGLITPDFMKSYLVLENPADARIVLLGLPNLTYTVRSLRDVRTHPDDRASIAIEYTAVHQQKLARWYFLKDDGVWMLDQEDLLDFDPGLDSASVTINMKDFAYEPANSTVKAQPVIHMKVTNSGSLPHEVVLVKVAPGTDPTTLLQPGVQAEGVEFFGQTMAVPGQERQIVLTAVPPGQYVMVCQLRFPKGPLHSGQGMVGLLIVE